MDDVRPGNVLRPDSGRLFYAFYWCMLMTPPWWRTSEWGWYDLCFILHTKLLTILGGYYYYIVILLFTKHISTSMYVLHFYFHPRGYALVPPAPKLVGQ